MSVDPFAMLCVCARARVCVCVCVCARARARACVSDAEAGCCRTCPSSCTYRKAPSLRWSCLFFDCRVGLTRIFALGAFVVPVCHVQRVGCVCVCVCRATAVRLISPHAVCVCVCVCVNQVLYEQNVPFLVVAAVFQLSSPTVYFTERCAPAKNNTIGTFSVMSHHRCSTTVVHSVQHIQSQRCTTTVIHQCKSIYGLLSN